MRSVSSRSVLECGSPVPLSTPIWKRRDVWKLNKLLQSAAGAAHSKTWRSSNAFCVLAKRLGVREPCPAFGANLEAPRRLEVEQAVAKRRRGGALQNLAEFQCALCAREASW